HVGESSVTVVVIENVLAKVGDEEIFVAVVVVVADADALSPAGVTYTCFCSDIGESSIAIVAKKMRNRLAARRKSFQTRAINQKNVEPSVVVVVIEGDAASGSFKQIFIFVLAAEDGFRVQAGLAGNVEEGYAEVLVGW